jgi:hypothetical protein
LRHTAGLDEGVALADEDEDEDDDDDEDEDDDDDDAVMGTSREPILLLARSSSTSSEEGLFWMAVMKAAHSSSLMDAFCSRSRCRGHCGADRSAEIAALAFGPTLLQPVGWGI